MSEIRPTPFKDWAVNNPPGPNMLWRSGAHRQIYEIAATTQQFGPAVVVATHTSKSITLPVVKFHGPFGDDGLPRGVVWLRDNFYTVEVCVQWTYPPLLTEQLTHPGRRCFLEGLVHVAPAAATEPWAAGRSAFAVSTDSWEEARALLRRLWESLPPKEGA